MSIIHDALNKVQKKMQPSLPINDSNNTPLSAPGNEKLGRQKPSWLILIFSIIVILFVLWRIQIKYPEFLWGIHPSFIIKASSSSPVSAKFTTTPLGLPNKTLTQLPPSASTLVNTTMPTSSNPSVLNIKGVMSSEGRNVALINNSIYEESSMINGVKILKINMHAILIERDGKQETIEVRK